jgi:hypothetical protein
MCSHHTNDTERLIALKMALKTDSSCPNAWLVPDLETDESTMPTSLLDLLKMDIIEEFDDTDQKSVLACDDNSFELHSNPDTQMMFHDIPRQVSYEGLCRDESSSGNHDLSCLELTDFIDPNGTIYNSNVPLYQLLDLDCNRIVKDDDTINRNIEIAQKILNISIAAKLQNSRKHADHSPGTYRNEIANDNVNESVEKVFPNCDQYANSMVEPCNLYRANDNSSPIDMVEALHRPKISLSLPIRTMSTKACAVVSPDTSKRVIDVGSYNNQFHPQLQFEDDIVDQRQPIAFNSYNGKYIYENDRIILPRASATPTTEGKLQSEIESPHLVERTYFTNEVNLPMLNISESFPLSWVLLLNEWEYYAMDLYHNKNAKSRWSNADQQRYSKRYRGIKMINKLASIVSMDRYATAHQLDILRGDLSCSAHLAELEKVDGTIKRRRRRQLKKLK